MKKYVDFSPVKENGKKSERNSSTFCIQVFDKRRQDSFHEIKHPLKKVDLRKSRL